MKPINFSWDENKNKSNINKHKVSFEEAKSIFYDENAIEFFDIEHSDNEDRFLMLGVSSRLRILLVCYCVRESKTIRIISARKATKNEKKYYPGDKA